MPYHLRNGLYAHPFEAVACISTMLSVYGAFRLLVYRPQVLDAATSGILSMPKYILWIWVVMGFVGAVVTLIGLGLSIFSRKGRQVEASGLWLMGAMWLTAAVARMALDLAPWEEYLRYWAIGLGCVTRLLMLYEFQGIMDRAPREADTL